MEEGTMDAAKDGLGRAIARYRRRLGLSQEELGARLGLDQRQVSRLEHGLAAWPDPALLARLAAELGVSEADLLREAGYLAPAAEETLPPARVFAMAAAQLEDLPAEDRAAAQAALQFAIALYRRRHGAPPGSN